MVITLNLVCHATGEQETIEVNHFDNITVMMMKWLNANQNKTFKFLKDVKNSYIEDEIELFVKEFCFDNVIEVVETSDYIKEKRIESANDAINFLINGGAFHSLDLKYRSDVNVCSNYIKLGKWDGNIKELLHSTFESREEPGRVIHYSELFDNFDFVESLLHSGYPLDKYFKYFRESMRERKEFNKILLESSQWNGDFDVFRGECVDDVEFCIKVVQNARWNKRLECFKPFVKQNILFLKSLAETCKVFPTLKNFPEYFLKDEDFWKGFIRSGKWNGSFFSLSLDLTSNKTGFCSFAIESGKWNGSPLGISFNMITNEKIWIKIINSPFWNGKCGEFPQELNSYSIFCCMVVAKERWDQDWSPFSKNILNSRRFHEAYYDYFMKRRSHISGDKNSPPDPSELIKLPCDIDTLYHSWQEQVLAKFICKRGIVPYTA